MNTPKHLEVMDGFARLAPCGNIPLVETVDLVTTAIAFCRARAIRRLLVDSTGLVGFTPPDLADRYWMVQDWAHEARGQVAIALIANAEHIDPNRFGVVAAADAGLVLDVFTTESDALGWLLGSWGDGA